MDDRVEGQNVDVVLSGFRWQLERPALDDLLIAEVAEEGDKQAEEVVEDGDGFGQQVDGAEEEEVGKQSIDDPLEPPVNFLHFFLVLLGRVVRHCSQQHVKYI